MMAARPTMGDRIARMPQRARRLVVAEAFLGYPLLILGYTALVATDIVPVAIWAPIAIALMAMSLVGVALTYAWARGRTEPREALDERQRAMLDRAHVLSYGVLATVLVGLSAILAFVAAFDGPILLTMEGLTPFFIALGLYLPMLPAAVLAVIEPDADLDEDAGSPVAG